MGKQLPFRLILASGSPARRDLLHRAGYTFQVIPSQVDEPMEADFTDAAALVEHIAWLKAHAVARQMTTTSGERRAESGEPEGLGSRLSALGSPLPDPAVILAADTIGWLHGRPIGKPADEAEARRILSLLMGTEHELWTGVCLWLWPQNLQVAWQEVSRVEMTPLAPAELDAYLAGGAWRGCSGAYAIQEEGEDPLVHVRQGTKSNVIGLPMETLEEVFRWLTMAAPPGLPNVGRAIE